MATMSSSARPGVGADADHVVDDEFDGGIGYRVRPQVVAFGHEGAPPLPRGDVALAFQIHIGAIHRVVADIQIHRQGAHRRKPIAGDKGSPSQ